MTNQTTMLREIIEEHSDRIKNMKKYYPYFRLAETSLAQYRDGQFACLDMGYITLAVIRFFIEENNFKEKDVTYQEYYAFLKELLKRDFDLELEREEEQDLIAFLFDKLKNEGKPFSFDYYDPTDHKRKTMRSRFMDSKIEDGVVYYYITSDAIEFYLDTKEIKDESTINVEQLLLEKLISTQNFRGGTEVAKRINNEVGRLMRQKNEVLGILSYDVFAGVEAFEKFMGSTMRWFKEEQKLFVRNSDLIHKALERAESDGAQGDYQSRYYQAIDEIYQLELELKKAIARHSELLGACTVLQKKVGELVAKSKFAALKRSLDFKRMGQRLMERDRADLLEALVMPLFDVHPGKTLTLGRLEDLLMVSPEKTENAEAVSEGEEQIYIYEDEIEDARIQKNYILLFENLLQTLERKESFTLKEWQEQLLFQLGEQVVRNADYYSFLVHLAQKKEYNVRKMIEKPDTFLEEAVKVFLEEHKEYEEVDMTLTMLPEEELLLGEKMSVTNLLIERGN
ncbi:MAG: hypothetical protein J6B94_04075 [Lachnospiraceae bacterium]|nr:hypothetical protein [Lachnospiraceae bacterium]